MKRRILPMFMAVMMILSIIQVPAWATDESNPMETADSTELADVGGNDYREGSGEEKPVPEEETYVAQVGEKKYTTLQEAIDEAKDGATIRLLKDVTDGAGIIVQGSSNRTLTIDFDEYTYTVTHKLAGSQGTQSQCFQLLQGSTITMKNGAIVANNSSIQMIIQNYCNLTLENMTLNANEGSNSISYVMSNNCGNVVLTGDTNIIAKESGCVAFDAYFWPSNGYKDGVTVTLDANMTGTISGNIECTQDATATADGEQSHIVIEAGTVEGNITISSQGSITISGDGTKVKGDISSSNTGIVVISDGVSVDGTISNTGSGTMTVLNSSVGSIAEDSKDSITLINSEVGGQPVEDTVPEGVVALVDGRPYSTLSTAITAAAEASDHTILLLNDVTESITIAGGTTIVLDLNGHTITNTADQHTITNNGTLTVQDSSTSQSGTVDNVTHAKGALVNYGTATLKGGTFTRSKEASTSPSNSGGNSWYVIDNQGTMTIDGATVTNNGYFSSLIRNLGQSAETPAKLTVSDGLLQNKFITLKNDDYSEMTIKGGKITSDDQAIQNWGNANISGGTLEGSVITWSYKDHASETTISDDAQITGDVVAVNYDNSESNPTVNIKGGTVIGRLRKGLYSGGIVDQNPDAATSEIKVTGGSFSESVNENYLADTLNAELIRADSSAPYSYYSSVAEAQKAAGDEDIVVDLSQSTGEGNEMVQVTLNFNGNGTANKSYSVMKGVTIVLPTPRRFGYTFEGWYDGDTRVSNPYKVTKAVTLTAEWDYKDDDHGSGSGSSSSSSSSSVRRYDIEADAGRGGEISPDGRVRVRRGENQTFRITADDGWEIADVEVDGESVGAVERYTFENVRTDHTISATFRQIDAEPETPTLPFTDVAEGDWYYDAVAYCWENGIMDGTSGTAFAPNMLLNRAMMAQVLYNLAGGTASTVAGFPDVAASAWYADAVNWAAANGYVTGYDNGSYGPEDSLTREQLAVILYRYAGSPAPAGSLDGFADAASASAYAVDALRWAVGEGLLTGKDGGRLDPTGTASRAELAQILARFAQM